VRKNLPRSNAADASDHWLPDLLVGERQKILRQLILRSLFTVFTLTQLIVAYRLRMRRPGAVPI